VAVLEAGRSYRIPSSWVARDRSSHAPSRGAWDGSFLGEPFRGQQILRGTAAPLSNQPRPEAEALGWPPRGGRSRQIAPVGGVDVKRSLAVLHGVDIPFSATGVRQPGRMRFIEGTTPDRSKLFGSHGHRPWV
jgi:hypothetical protein